MNEKIDLVKDTIENDDIDALIEWLKTYPRLTKGNLTVEFQEKWSEWLGVNHSVFVNSGSSALLLMLQALKTENRIKNNKIVIPQLSWATDLSSPMILGFEPILCDVNLDDLSVCLENLESIFIKEKPSTLLLVSVLGFSPDMEKTLNLCNKYEVILLEDVCESQGTIYNCQKLGTFGLMSSFSTYFGHSMSTVEGGVVCTNDSSLNNTLLQLRSHGWDRDLPENMKKSLREDWDVNDFNSLFTFYTPSFNLRSTDLQAFIGLRQLEKVDGWLDIRNKNYEYLRNSFAEYGIWIPKPPEKSWTANFCYPFIFDSFEEREKVIESLNKNNIECRPLISGSMGSQPMYVEKYGELTMKNSSKTDQCGLYIPNHPKLTKEELDLMIKSVTSAISYDTNNRSQENIRMLLIKSELLKHK